MKFNNYKTNKGTELPLINLKGKAYMQVAHRLVWLTEEVPSYTTSTEFLLINDDQTIAKVTVSILDKEGKVLKSVTATKRETKKDFPDHTEKAETGALGRALAMLGFGTQFAIADMEENDRLADSPVAVPTEQSAPKVAVTSGAIKEAAPAATPKPKPFSRTKPVSNEDGY
jgi:uncharacterized protein YbcV (DUF1398 family)